MQKMIKLKPIIPLPAVDKMSDKTKSDKIISGDSGALFVMQKFTISLKIDVPCIFITNFM